jgi:hypothetical protein
MYVSLCGISELLPTTRTNYIQPHAFQFECERSEAGEVKGERDEAEEADGERDEAGQGKAGIGCSLVWVDAAIVWPPRAK